MVMDHSRFAGLVVKDSSMTEPHGYSRFDLLNRSGHFASDKVRKMIDHDTQLKSLDQRMEVGAFAAVRNASLLTQL